MILASLRGTVITKSVRAMLRIVGTKNGIRNTACLFKPRCARGLSTGVCCPSHVSTIACERFRFRKKDPDAMHRGHDLWLLVLKQVSEK
jgi:hypothetical protein